MNNRFEFIRQSMLNYGIILGGIAGVLSGTLFTMSAYPLFMAHHVLLMAFGGITGGLLGLAFGAISGVLCGWIMSFFTRFLLADYRVRRIYKPLMGLLSSAICSLLFLKMAYLIGRPFIYYNDTNLAWVWLWFTVILCAFVCGVTTADSVLQSTYRKAKNH